MRSSATSRSAAPSKLRRHSRSRRLDGQLAAAVAIEDKDAERARQIAGLRRIPIGIDAGDKGVHGNAAARRHRAKGAPKLLLQRDARAVAGKDDGALFDGGVHLAPRRMARQRGPSIASGRTQRAKSAAVTEPRATAAASSVVPS